MAILVLDDEKDARESLEVLLEFAGYRVITASNAEEALELLKSNTIRLMLVDLMMPGMNGDDFIKRARQQGHKAEALLVTALAPRHASALTELGIGYMRKPYDGRALLNTVETLLRKGVGDGYAGTCGGDNLTVA